MACHQTQHWFGNVSVLSPFRRDVIVWTNADLSSINPMTNPIIYFLEKIFKNIVCKLSTILFQGHYVKACLLIHITCMYINFTNKRISFR